MSETMAAAEPFGIGEAIRHLKLGRRVSRLAWNGRGSHLKLENPDKNSKMTLPYIYMFTNSCHLVPWVAAQIDLLAEDWVLVARPE